MGHILQDGQWEALSWNIINRKITHIVDFARQITMESWNEWLIKEVPVSFT